MKKSIQDEKKIFDDARLMKQKNYYHKIKSVMKEKKKNLIFLNSFNLST